MEDKEQARGYRQRAADLRRLATNFRDDSARGELLALADQWEQMAERIETRMPLRDALSALNRAQRKDRE